MSNHPFNLILRFVLELTATAALAYWGWVEHQGLGRVLWAIGLPALAAVIWGTFRVPDDPGSAPVAVPGQVRLTLEILLFGTAVAMLFAAGQPLIGLMLGIVLVIHYAFSYDRVRWLITGER